MQRRQGQGSREVKMQHDDVTTTRRLDFVGGSSQRPPRGRYRRRRKDRHRWNAEIYKVYLPLTRQDVPEVAIGSGVNLRIGEHFFLFFSFFGKRPLRGRVPSAPQRLTVVDRDLFFIFYFFSSIRDCPSDGDLFSWATDTSQVSAANAFQRRR